MVIESLNDKQKEAVLNIGGPMLVFAGAGSGKTRVLTYKIAYLIQNVGMPPKNILAVTVNFIFLNTKADRFVYKLL